MRETGNSSARGGKHVWNGASLGFLWEATLVPFLGAQLEHDGVARGLGLGSTRQRDTPRDASRAGLLARSRLGHHDYLPTPRRKSREYLRAPRALKGARIRTHHRQPEHKTRFWRLYARDSIILAREREGTPRGQGPARWRRGPTRVGAARAEDPAAARSAAGGARRRPRQTRRVDHAGVSASCSSS